MEGFKIFGKNKKKKRERGGKNERGRQTLLTIRIKEEDSVRVLT